MASPYRIYWMATSEHGMHDYALSAVTLSDWCDSFLLKKSAAPQGCTQACSYQALSLMPRIPGNLFSCLSHGPQHIYLDHHIRGIDALKKIAPVRGNIMRLQVVQSQCLYIRQALGAAARIRKILHYNRKLFIYNHFHDIGNSQILQHITSQLSCHNINHPLL